MTDDQLEKALEVALDEILEEFPLAEEVAVILIDNPIVCRTPGQFTIAAYDNPYGQPHIVVSLPALRRAVSLPGMNLLEVCRKVLRHEFGHAAGLTHDHPKMPEVLTA